LECDTAVANGEKSAATQAQRIAPFERDDFTGIVNGLDDADHLGCCKLLFGHGADIFAADNGLLRDLMIDGIVVIKVCQPGRIDRIEPAHPGGNNVFRCHRPHACPGWQLALDRSACNANDACD